MAKKTNISGKEVSSELDYILRCSGHLYPKTENELEIYEDLYHNFNSSLSDLKIDINEIIEGNFDKSGKIVDMTPKDFSGLKMAARKGELNIPQEIIDAMKSKHNNGNK